MTNEEKSKELCGACTNCTFSCGDRLNCKVEAKYNIAMEMAKWKEQQFRMIIERTIDLFDKYPSNAVFSKDNVVEMFKTLKKAMGE